VIPCSYDDKSVEVDGGTGEDRVQNFGGNEDSVILDVLLTSYRDVVKKAPQSFYRGSALISKTKHEGEMISKVSS